ncbi:GtrA family protein [Paenibacillus medicaginis]|uniref:GtrA family protein n=1 Tax=Paenibacillus medicaginis TaxID=1470560 RepID=A0ABV5C535_9BACL
MAMRAFIGQFLRFGTVGALNTGIDYIVFIALTWEGMLPLPAQIVSYLCGAANSYLLNRGWTFRGNSSQSPQSRQLISFIIVNLITLACTSVVLEGLLHGTSWSLLACKLIATLAGLTINYTGSRFWVFGSRQGKERDAS